MKILYVTHQYFPYFYTGTELLTDNLSRYIRFLGDSTEVWAYNLEEPDLNKIDRTSYKGIPVTFFSHHNNEKDKDWLLYRENKEKNKDFKKLIKDSNPDVIHITHSARMGDIIEAAYKLGVPYVMTLTDYWLLCPTATLIRRNGELCGGTGVDPNCLKYCYRNKKEEMEKRWVGVKDILEKASFVGYAANFLRKMFEINGIDTSKWINIRHGYNINDRRIRTRDSFYRFAFTGTLQPSKGAHLVIEAFRKISNDKIRLVMYGETKHDAAYSDHCLSLARGDNRIEFRGRYDHSDLVEEFKDIDCIIVPSNWFEPFPFTLITAVSYGFQVIGANIGGIPEIIGDENKDSLFEPGNTQDLKEKMIKKVIQGKKPNNLFYEQSLESEAFKYFQIYNLLSN